MKRSIATRIDYSMLSEGAIYRVRIPAMGEVLARLTNKEKLELEITEGRLQSQADKAKQWRVGNTFSAIPGIAEFWEPR